MKVETKEQQNTDAVKRRDSMDIKITSKNTENNLKQILAKTDFLNYEQYLEARTAADSNCSSRTRVDAVINFREFLDLCED